MQAYVATPQGVEPFPAIIVLQEAFGVNDHIRDVADRLAREGYLAIAPELFHRTAPPHLSVSYSEFLQVAPHIQAITPEGSENDLRSVYEWLQSQNNIQKQNIASIGFCMGGRVAYIANSILPLKASISFYGGYIHSMLDRAEKLQAPQLFFWGGKDQHIKTEHINAVVDAVRNAGKEFINVEISYADHGFFCNEREQYNPQAALEAWGMVKAFLKNKLKKS